MFEKYSNLHNGVEGDGACRRHVKQTSVFQTFLGQGTLFSLKKSRGPPPAESVEKRTSIAYIDSYKVVLVLNVGKF